VQVRLGTGGLIAGLLLAGAVIAAEETSAIAQFQALRQSLHASHVAGNWQANLEAARRQRAFLQGSPNSQLEVARAELFLGHPADGLAALTTYARMGQSIDPAPLAPHWPALSGQPGFVQLRAALAANTTAVTRAATAFTLADPALLPEDIDYEARTALFYLSSVREKKIITASVHGEVHEFAPAPDGWPVIALKVDARHGRLWATEVALQGYAFAPQADWGRSVLLAFDLRTHAVFQRIEGPRGSALGDMLLLPDGTVIVSDGEGGGLYRLALQGTRLERLDHGDFISPQTPALHPDGAHVYVPDYVRGVALLDLQSGAVQWLAMSDRFALAGIDGLYFEGGRLLATQNGTSPERVVAFHLAPSLTALASETIIERGPTLGDPTHGVVVGDSFYYIANAGWDVIDEHGQLRRGAQLPQSRVMRAALARP
jgi:hypothetical protein